MYNITLISTIHTERGMCNSDELYKIIESIGPDIIFEEVPESLFKICYENQKINDAFLEIKCVKKYLGNYDVKHFPVDNEVCSKLSNDQINYLFNFFQKYDAYKELENLQKSLMENEGFSFLTSEKCSDIFAEKVNLELQLIDFSSNKAILTHHHDLFYREQESRETAMIGNIYKLSSQHPYNKAVFWLGCGHRKSILQKFNELDKTYNQKLNWSLYSSI